MGEQTGICIRCMYLGTNPDPVDRVPFVVGDRVMVLSLNLVGVIIRVVSNVVDGRTYRLYMVSLEYGVFKWDEDFSFEDLELV